MTLTCTSRWSPRCTNGRSHVHCGTLKVASFNTEKLKISSDFHRYRDNLQKHKVTMRYRRQENVHPVVNASVVMTQPQLQNWTHEHGMVVLGCRFFHSRGTLSYVRGNWQRISHENSNCSDAGEIDKQRADIWHSRRLTKCMPTTWLSNGEANGQTVRSLHCISISVSNALARGVPCKCIGSILAVLCRLSFGMCCSCDVYMVNLKWGSRGKVGVR